eukprot:304106_1
MEQKSFVSVIFMTSMLIFCIPIYVYLIIKWYKLRNHFVLLNRFPLMSITIVLCSVVTPLIGIIELVTNIIMLRRIIQMLTAITMGLVFHRPHLIYIRCCINSNYLQTMTSSADLPKSTRSSSLISHALFGFTVVVVAALMFFLCLLPYAIAILFQIQMVIGLFHTIRLIRSKASESLDCIKESVLSITFVLIMCAVPPVLQPHMPEYIDLYRIGGMSVISVIASCALFIPIRLIHKVDKSKTNSRIYMNKIQVPPTNSAVTMSTSVALSFHKAAPMPSMTLSPTLSVSTMSHSDDTLTYNKCNSGAEFHVTTLKQSLDSFLQTQQHYQLFTGYLSECFALENLMFLERGIILYHMILKCKKLDTGFVAVKHEEEGSDIDKFEQTFYDISFHYLVQMYADMDSIIQKAVEVNKDSDAMKYKRGIVKIMRLIYSGCCCSKSETQINTSYGVQVNLQRLLEDEDEERLLSKFEDYDDLLNVFHDALVQICDVCDCVYDFQFKSYCRNQNHQI